jgi:hypothetical protein
VICMMVGLPIPATSSNRSRQLDIKELLACDEDVLGVECKQKCMESKGGTSLQGAFEGVAR